MQVNIGLRQGSAPSIVFHLNNVINQQKDKPNRCSEEDHVRRRSCDRS